MIHSVLITAHPDNTDVYNYAMSACLSKIESGDRINQVFFMHDATHMAVHENAGIWQELAESNDFELHSCVSTAEELDIEFKNYAPGFLQGGLSVLADSILRCDNVLQFGYEEILSQSDKTALLALASKELEAMEKLKVYKKNIVFVFQTAPIENSFVKEGIDLLLVLSAFDAQLNVVFRAAGVQNLMINAISPRYIKRFKALSDFGIDKCYVVNADDQDFSIPVEPISDNELHKLTQNSHVLYF